MPAVLDDPTAPPIFHVANNAPFSSPFGETMPDISLRQVTLRDRITIATLVPFSSPRQVPHKLLAYLCELLNREIEKGDTYPMMDSMSVSSFGEYWFGNFGAAMIMGDIQSVEELGEMDSRGIDWSKECLGSFFIKPNYPGRSSHICNGGFLVTDAKRNRGVGRLMGEGYIEWAPKLGYTYSVFNLVYETNVASLRIWDALGFKRIGRIKGAGNLKSQPGELVDAIMFGRELGSEGDEYVSEERFDKIRFYLKTGTYPNGSDRAEKSRLRSAATHYRLIQGSNEDGQDDKLMLKGKEVVSDPHKQYEIARNMHGQGHGGINKTTASIAEHYHWVRIKETVSAAIKNCPECKDSAPKKSTSTFTSARRAPKDYTAVSVLGPMGTNGGTSSNTIDLSHTASMALPGNSASHHSVQHSLSDPNVDITFHDHTDGDYSNLPVDPRIMLEMNERTLQQWDEAAAAVAATTAVNGASNMSLDRDVVETDNAFKLDLDHGNGHASGHHDDDDDDDINARLRETLQAEMGNNGSLQHHQHPHHDQHHDQHQHHHLQHHQHQHQQHPHHHQHPHQHH